MIIWITNKTKQRIKPMPWRGKVMLLIGRQRGEGGHRRGDETHNGITYLPHHLFGRDHVICTYASRAPSSARDQAAVGQVSPLEPPPPSLSDLWSRDQPTVARIVSNLYVRFSACVFNIFNVIYIAQPSRTIRVSYIVTLLLDLYKLSLNSLYYRGTYI